MSDPSAGLTFGVATSERERLAALHRYGVLDSAPEPAFEDLVALAARLCGTSTALVSLVDEQRQWFKARLGFDPCETGRDVSFCAHALGGPDVLVVPDARKDPRFADNTLVTGPPHVRFYAGAPLVTPAGFVLGTLCVLDTVPRGLSPQQRADLVVLARQVMDQLELRRQAEALAAEVGAKTAAELALRSNEQLLAGILRHTDAVVYAKDADGRYLMANPAHAALLGLGPDDVLGRSDYDLFPVVAADAYRAHDLQVVASGRREVFAEDARHPDGTVHSYLSTKFPLLDDTGDVVAVAGVSTDVTEIAAERTAHAEAEQRWKALVEHSPVAVAVIGANGCFAYANPEAVALYGAGPGELVGRRAAELVPDDDDGQAARLFHSLLTGGAPVRAHRWTLRRLDGRRCSVEINAAAVTYRGEPAIQVELRDTSVQDAAQRALTEVNAQLQAGRAFTDAVLESIDVGVVACDAQGRLSLFNHAAKSWHGLDPAQHPDAAGDPTRFGEAFDLRTSAGDVVPPSDVPLLVALREGAVRDVEMIIAPRQHPPRLVSCTGRAMSDAEGRVLGAVVAMTDITQQRQHTKALQASEQRFRTTFDTDPAGLVIVDPDLGPVQVNPALRRLLGWSETALLASHDIASIAVAEDRDAVRELLRHAAAATDPGDGPATAEKQVLRRDGSTLWALLTATALPGPADTDPQVLLQVEDITDRKDAERVLTRQALHDGLTGLLNRAVLMDRTTQALARLRRGATGLTVMLFLDLDGFKAVNDQHGHAAGDALLVQVSDRLAAALRPSDTVARLGGDEFVVLCEGLGRMDEATDLASRIEKVVARPYRWQGAELRVTASVGLAQATADLAAEDLLRRADTAMYQAKRLGKDRHELFDRDMLARATRRVRVEQHLRRAVDDDAVEVHYQPVVTLHSRTIVGLEALARLRLDDGALLPPDTFIPVAEDNGLIVPLGTSVLRQATAQLARWRAGGHPDLYVAVNLSARQAARPDLVEVVTASLVDAGVPATALRLELTESVLLEAARSTLAKLTDLRSAGVAIGIDDFGTGYSSLQNLRRLPVTFIKVDKSFVAGMLTDHQDAVIVRTVTRLANDLGLSCVVEGVETEDQLTALLHSGADAQGYLFHRPAPAAHTTEILG